jgi:hypothetical protein
VYLRSHVVKVGAFHSHLNGHEWLLIHRRQLWKEIERVVDQIDAEKCRTKESKEKTKLRRMLYSPQALNKRFEEEFRRVGWKESRTSYWVTDDYALIRQTVGIPPEEQKREIEAAGKRAILSYNQTDFVKDRVAVEVQMGKYSFIAYDLFVKHMAFYVGDQIDVGVEILPMKSMQEKMSSGPGYYEGALYDIARQGRGVPAVPLVLVGIVP